MKYNVLIHRYAKALLEYAILNNATDKVLEDMRFVKDTLEQNKELRVMISQPFISKNHKINIINQLFASRIEKVSLNFLTLMLDKNRESYIVDIYDKFHELYLEHKKIAVVIVTSAVKLDEQTSNRIVNILKHKIVKKDTIEIQNIIDKSIIGGFIVNYNDYQYDASVRSTLKRLHNIFDDNLFVKAY